MTKDKLKKQDWNRESKLLSKKINDTFEYWIKFKINHGSDLII